MQSISITDSCNLVAFSGCDSLIISILNVIEPDTSVSKNEFVLTSINGLATFQWFDCKNNYSIIPGETSQSFTASIDGSYAVQVTENNYIDTLSCYYVFGAGINEIKSRDEIAIFPNPNSGQFKIISGFGHINYEIYTNEQPRGRAPRYQKSVS